MQVFVFYIHSMVDIEEAWQRLEEEGCQLLYSTEDEDSKQILGYLPEKSNLQSILKKYGHLISGIDEKKFDDIDWESQWAQHALEYRDGFLHVDIKDYAPLLHSCPWPTLLKLKPGPGFGDLSHPTTRLVLKHMGKHVQGRHVLDIGCGSGILSLAALSMGALSVTGIDIDEKAIEHSKINSDLNGMKDAIDFCLPHEYKLPQETTSLLILMNMIQSEQKIAWQSIPSIHSLVDTALTSGILIEGAVPYIKMCALWNMHPVEQVEEEGWIGFVLKKIDLRQ